MMNICWLIFIGCAGISISRAYTYGIFAAGAQWYDFNSGEEYEGGKEIDAAAPLSRMPLFVKAGAIIPVIPVIEYTAQMNDAPITLNIFTGADGQLIYMKTMAQVTATNAVSMHAFRFAMMIILTPL